jgi:Cdc6-like AAA superfamily ATPase
MFPQHIDNVPPPQPLRHSSRLFTGRETYLGRLRDHFSTVAHAERRFFLLYGMGGIGKTQTCLKFVEENANL